MKGDRMASDLQIVTGRSFRKCIDVSNQLWQKISFWSKASDIEFDDGENAETKLGAIRGITADLNTTETGYAADMMALTQLNSKLVNIERLIQENTNHISALDTRVTNAINGGSLVAPFSENLLLYPYTNIVTHSGGDVTIANNGTNGFSYNFNNGTYSRTNTIGRKWNKGVRVDTKSKLNFSFTLTGTNASDATPLIQVVNSGGSVLLQQSSYSGTISLSSLNGQTVFIQIQCTCYRTGVAGLATFTFSRIEITNK